MVVYLKYFLLISMIEFDNRRQVHKPILTFSQEITIYGAHNKCLPIFLNMGTVELSVNKWENKVTGVIYLKT